MAYLDLLNAVARVVGGTQPDSTHSSVSADRQPYWFSGADAGDGSGVSGIVGCYSLPVESLDSTPVGMVLPSNWKPQQQHPTMGRKFIEDEVRLRIMTGHDTITARMALLINYRDLIESAFDQHMQLFGTLGVLQVTAWQGDFLEVELGGESYLAVEFIVLVERGLSVTYVG